jgi:hypothetical protein
MNGLQYRTLLVIASRRVEGLVSLKSVSWMRKDFVQLHLARFRPTTIGVSIFQRFIRVLPLFPAPHLTELPAIAGSKSFVKSVDCNISNMISLVASGLSKLRVVLGISAHDS